MPITQDPKNRVARPWHDTGRRGKNVPRGGSYDSVAGSNNPPARPKAAVAPAPAPAAPVKKPKPKKKTGATRKSAASRTTKASVARAPVKLTQDPKRRIAAPWHQRRLRSK